MEEERKEKHKQRRRLMRPLELQRRTLMMKKKKEERREKKMKGEVMRYRRLLGTGRVSNRVSCFSSVFFFFEGKTTVGLPTFSGNGQSVKVSSAVLHHAPDSRRWNIP